MTIRGEAEQYCLISETMVCGSAIYGWCLGSNVGLHEGRFATSGRQYYVVFFGCSLQI